MGDGSAKLGIGKLETKTDAEEIFKDGTQLREGISRVYCLSCTLAWKTSLAMA